MCHERKHSSVRYKQTGEHHNTDKPFRYETQFLMFDLLDHIQSSEDYLSLHTAGSPYLLVQRTFDEHAAPRESNLLACSHAERRDPLTLIELILNRNTNWFKLTWLILFATVIEFTSVIDHLALFHARTTMRMGLK